MSASKRVLLVGTGISSLRVAVDRDPDHALRVDLRHSGPPLLVTVIVQEVPDVGIAELEHRRVAAGPCPTCGVVQGERCTNLTTGEPVAYTHVGRWEVGAL